MTPRVAATTLEQAVLETIAYSDVFNFPLTASEVHRCLPLAATSQDVGKALASLSAAGYIVQAEEHYTLRGREPLISLRRARQEASRRLMRRAASYGRWIARMPFVRMVAVTGSLAVENAGETDDVDYLIVTAPRRVWLARAATMLVVRMAALRGLTLCPNYVISEDALALPERDVYTARELLQMRPLCGYYVHVRMLTANSWVREVLPNWDAHRSSLAERAWLPAAVGERLFGGRLGDALERALLRRKGRELRLQAGDNHEAVFDETMCKGHFDAHRSRLQRELKERLQHLEVAP